MYSKKAPHVVKCGWVDKQIQRGLPVFVTHSQRFLVLTSKWLRYYHEAVSLNSVMEDNPEGSQEAFIEIPLDQINESAMLSMASTFPGVVYIQHSGTQKIYKFRTSCEDEALEWRVAITTLRSHLLPSVTINNDSAKVQQADEDENSSSQDTIIDLKLYDPLVIRAESLFFSTEERAKLIAENYFAAINLLPVRERNNRAKEIGRGLVAWLEERPDTASNHQSNKAASVDDDSLVEKTTIANIWFRTALTREFYSSCKFEEPQPAVSVSASSSEAPRVSEDGESSSVSSSLTHSTVRSRIRQAHRGSIIMPFRADTAECLFLSSIMYASCTKESTLKAILHTVLRPVASSPENFTFPKPVLANTNLLAMNSYEKDTHSVKPSQQQITWWSRLWSALSCSSTHDIVVDPPTSLSQQQIQQSHRNEESIPGDSQHAIDRSRHSVRSSSSNNNNNSSNSNINNNDDRGVTRTFSLSEIAVLTPVEVQRIEVRHRLIDVVSELVERLQNSSSSNDVPSLLVSVVHAIRDIIISPHAESKDVSEDDSEMVKLRRRFEYGTFFTSCCALLFLRLICRAIVTPDEYGVTDRLQQSVDVAETLDYSLWPNRALPFVTCIAHALRNDQLSLAKPRDSNHSQKKHNRLTAAQIDEIIAVVDELKKSISLESAAECLDVFEHHNYCLSSGDELHSQELNRTRTNYGDDSTSYKFDFSKPSTRWALAEVAKSVQHIANISCLPKEEMQAFARESLVRQNIAAGVQDKDTYDTHELTGPETETILAQIQIASKFKEVYEKLGELPTGNW